MPPIKRNQKPGAEPPRRRLAGHGTPTAAGAADRGGSPNRRVAGPRAGVAPGPVRNDDGPAGDPSGPAGGTPSPGSGRVLAYAGVALGLVALVAGLVMWFAVDTEQVPDAALDNRAFIDTEATDEVLTAATTNVQRLVAIDHETLDEYHASLPEFLTPALVEELEQTWPTLRDTYEQTATAVDAVVNEAGLTYLEEDKAEVLLVQDVSMTQDGVAAGSTSGTYLVGMDKVDGVWKLSRIPDLPS